MLLLIDSYVTMYSVFFPHYVSLCIRRRTPSITHRCSYVLVGSTLWTLPIFFSVSAQDPALRARITLYFLSASFLPKQVLRMKLESEW